MSFLHAKNILRQIKEAWEESCEDRVTIVCWESSETKLRDLFWWTIESSFWDECLQVYDTHSVVSSGVMWSSLQQSALTEDILKRELQ